MDTILGICGAVLALALLPSFKRGNRPSALTSAFCSSALLIMALTYGVSDLLAAASVALVSSCMWFALLMLKVAEA